MKRPNDPDALAPLLESIGREVAERRAHLDQLEERIAALRASPFYSGELGLLEADAAADRLELRHCREELERLGCSVVGTAPLTIRFPRRDGGPQKSRTWRHGQKTNN